MCDPYVHWILQLSMRKKKIVMFIRIRHTCVALIGLHKKTVLSVEQAQKSISNLSNL